VRAAEAAVSGRGKERVWIHAGGEGAYRAKGGSARWQEKAMRQPVEGRRGWCEVMSAAWWERASKCRQRHVKVRAKATGGG